MNKGYKAEIGTDFETCRAQKYFGHHPAWQQVFEHTESM